MKKLFLLLVAFISLGSLSACSFGGNGIITEISSETEYTKIENEITDVYETVSKGCVGIVVSNSQTSATGSGVIYKYDADASLYYVVTNAHVVEDMTTCKIYFGGSKYNSADIVGYDSKNDIGVITFSLDLLNGDLKDEIYVNDFFNYDKADAVAVGQTVLAIGCPLGIENYNILTTGVVSSVSSSKISIDAAINPGNSGGGLFNLAGRCIGINTEKEVWTTSTSNSGYEESIPVEGRGYAISMTVVKDCINDIVDKKGVVERPLLGITVATVNAILNPNSEYDQYLPEDGEVVHFIVTGFNEDPGKQAPARKAGILMYDVIVKVEGNKVTSATDITDVLNTKLMSETITLEIYRIVNGTPTTKTITVSFQ